MIESKSECVDCGKPCIHSCEYKHVKRYYCDVCRNEVEEMYRCEGLDICKDCIKKEHAQNFVDWLKDTYYDDLWEKYCYEYLETGYEEVED